MKTKRKTDSAPKLGVVAGSAPWATCTQCGQAAVDLEEDYQPEILVLAENFGEPYLFGVRCRVCFRVAKGVGREAAIKRWQDGGHDGSLDDFGNDGDDE